MKDHDDDENPFIDPNIIHWTVRISLHKQVQRQVRRLARQDMRSAGSMIGVLLAEGVTARSSA